MPTATMRHRAYEVLDKGLAGSPAADAVHVTLIVLILVNVVAVILESVPAIAGAYGTLFVVVEIVSTVIFTIEYGVRLWTAPEHPLLQAMRPLRARLRHAMSPSMVVDLIVILPFYVSLIGGIDLRFLLLLRLARFFKLARYSPGFASLTEALWSERRALGASLIIFIGVLVIAAAAMRLAEHDAQPDKFATIPDALWWAVITLTTVGYGDVFPVTPAGKLIAGVTAITGVAMLALPVGIIATAFAREIQRRDFVVTWSMVSSVPLFAGLDAASIADVMRSLKSVTYEPGAVICRAGQQARAMFVVAEGEVVVETDDGPIGLAAGQCFGETAVLNRTPLHATVRAMQRAKVLILDAEDLHHLMSLRPAIGVVIAAQVQNLAAGAPDQA
ncbi:cyclic nucleotide-gated ion channel [Phreatobacter oligotrophus]|jgi:voltage-gated potassium channel|uniref:cyclic nucleotide-gated ion channel n=1 Tax=Phreatobacter oligotrophus TaxID=1122261 RepID=UPI0023565128|nr:cyclic nucleotide-gated ion channel [Phreatobacter oligotrophus]MBX9992894.1 cyclic nucleotide-gated ion channel/potassium channel family protein [Phreatobacter oligotrophus]